MDSLEELLFTAVSRGEKNNVGSLLAQGAKGNVVCAAGRTALGCAAEKGNLAILKILLEAMGVIPTLDTEDEQIQAQQKGHKGRKNKSRIGTDVETVCDYPLHKIASNSNSPGDTESEPDKNNSGYFIVVHNDGAAAPEEPKTAACALNDTQTPDGMEKLEWDSEIDGNEKESKVIDDDDVDDDDDDDFYDDDDDDWASLYRWYAAILDRTSPLLQLSPNPDINQQDTFGRSAVHYAAENGRLEALRLLKVAGCRIDVSDSKNFTPLHLAASRDQSSVVKWLLEAGAEINRKTSDKTSALHIAASRGYVETIWVLMDHGASVDTLDASDRTPLMLAVSRGHNDVVTLLLMHRANVNIEEIHGYTPLCEAVWQKQVPLAEMLLRAGAKITQSHCLLHYAILHRNVEMARLLIEAGTIVNVRDDNGDSPLILAARTGICELVTLLLQKGASVNCANSLTGSRPLHEAIEYLHNTQFEEFKAVFHELRAYGAKLNVQTCTGGETPLFRAILLERYKAASLLIKYGTDVNLCDIESCVVDNLTLARKKKNFPLVRMMVYAGFDLSNYANNLRSISDTDPMKGWLTTMVYNPMRLTDLCRIVIRKKMGERVYEKVTESYLPVTLKRFLLLEDLELV